MKTYPWIARDPIVGPMKSNKIQRIGLNVAPSPSFSRYSKTFWIPILPDSSAAPEITQRTKMTAMAGALAQRIPIKM